MFYIAPEDLSKIQSVVSKVIDMLSEGLVRGDLDIELGDEVSPLRVTGYWVADTMRIDIKVQGET